MEKIRKGNKISHDGSLIEFRGNQVRWGFEQVTRDDLLSWDYWYQSLTDINDISALPEYVRHTINYNIKIVAPEMLLMEYPAIHNWFVFKGLPVLNIEDKAILFCNIIQDAHKPLFDQLKKNKIIQVYEKL